MSLFDDLLSAFRQDITTHRYDTWASVLDYCRRSANPVGRLVLRIGGMDDPALDRSSDALCTALQLTNFWQDLDRDWQNGRLYVPLDDVAAEGARTSDLDDRRMTEPWQRVLKRVAGRTQLAFVAGRDVCDGVRRPAPLRTALYVARRHADPRAARSHRLRRIRTQATPQSRRSPALVLGAVLWDVRRGGRGPDARPGDTGGCSRNKTMSGRATSFYYSFLALPADKRNAIVAVWDFCRAVDDAVDEPGDRDPASALAQWRSELARLYDGREPQTPQGQHLAPFIAAFALPRSGFEDVIDGVAMDLQCNRYETFEALREYCLRVASAVGLVCVEIFGYRDLQTRDYAIDLGIALQLTNIIRDVAPDLQRDRVYIPVEDLQRFGCTEDDLRAGVVTDKVRRLLAFQVERARRFYRKAETALPRRDERRLVAARIMGAIYFELLRSIERTGYDVFRHRVRVGRPRQAVIAAFTWLKVMAAFK